jgi:hypothetical protein
VNGDFARFSNCWDPLKRDLQNLLWKHSRKHARNGVMKCKNGHDVLTMYTMGNQQPISPVSNDEKRGKGSETRRKSANND